MPAAVEDDKMEPERPNTPPTLDESGDRPPNATGNGIGAVVTNASATSHGENAISLREVNPVSVRLEGLSVTVDQSPNVFGRVFAKNAGARDSESYVKTILDNISAEMSSGCQ
jgi:hypothetical protein